MTEYTDSAGVRYIAKPAKRNSAGIAMCSGCAHKSGRDEEATPGCMEAPACMESPLTGDGAIIWTKKTSPNKKAHAALNAA
jgi:hypothetical protein